MSGYKHHTHTHTHAPAQLAFSLAALLLQGINTTRIAYVCVRVITVKTHMKHAIWQTNIA